MLKKRYSHYNNQLINSDVVREVSVDQARRMNKVLAYVPNLVFIGFGVNDWRQDIVVSSSVNRLSSALP